MTRWCCDTGLLLISAVEQRGSFASRLNAAAGESEYVYYMTTMRRPLLPRAQKLALPATVLALTVNYAARAVLPMAAHVICHSLNAGDGGASSLPAPLGPGENDVDPGRSAESAPSSTNRWDAPGLVATAASAFFAGDMAAQLVVPTPATHCERARLQAGAKCKAALRSRRV